MVAVAPVGQFNGFQSPRPVSGKLYVPSHCFIDLAAASMTLTAGRYYCVPFVVERATTFAGAWFYNGGAADNGETFKIAAFSESSSGGPGTLAKNFGEGTLTAAAAIRQLASSWSASPGVYYLEIVANTNMAGYTMSTIKEVSAVGQVPINHAANTLGMFSAALVPGTINGQPIPQCDYVAGTYANFPESTALALTTSIVTAGATPLFGLYA